MASAITYSKNLSGRKFDFDWFAIADPSLRGEINLNFKSPTSKKITGLDKMVQKWLLFLLTPNGSDVYDPNMGTDLHLVLEANANDRGYVSNLISSSVNDASEQLKAAQTEISDANSDEVFVSATIVELTFGLSSVDVKIRIMSASGASRVLTLPTPFDSSAPI